MKYILALIIIIGGATFGFSQTQSLVFTDDSTLEIVDEQKTTDAPISKITVKYKYFTADFKSIGKAHKPLDEQVLKKLARTNKSLAAQIKKIHTAYSLKQGDSQLYVATFNSVNYENFRSCDAAAPCRIKCQAVVITLNDNGKKENILIVKSIEKLR